MAMYKTFALRSLPPMRQQHTNNTQWLGFPTGMAMGTGMTGLGLGTGSGSGSPTLARALRTGWAPS